MFVTIISYMDILHVCLEAVAASDLSNQQTFPLKLERVIKRQEPQNIDSDKTISIGLVRDEQKLSM